MYFVLSREKEIIDQAYVGESHRSVVTPCKSHFNLYRPGRGGGGREVEGGGVRRMRRSGRQDPGCGIIPFNALEVSSQKINKTAMSSSSSMPTKRC